LVFALSTFWTVFVTLIVLVPLILRWVFALIERFKNREHLAGRQTALCSLAS